MNSVLFGVLALGVANFILLFWNLRLRSKITELEVEIRRRKQWHQRSLDQYRQI